MAKGVIRRPSESKIYNGVPYFLGRGWPNKRKAEADAKKRRTQGYLVRISKHPAGYYLYERWLGGKG